MKLKRWLGCLGGGGCFSCHRGRGTGKPHGGAGDSKAAANAAETAAVAVRKAKASAAEELAAADLAVSSILDRWDRRIPVPELEPSPIQALHPLDRAIPNAEDIKVHELDAVNLTDDANPNVVVDGSEEIEVDESKAQLMVEQASVSQESFQAGCHSEAKKEEEVVEVLEHVTEEGAEAADVVEPVNLSAQEEFFYGIEDSEADDQEVEVLQHVSEECEEAAEGGEPFKGSVQEERFNVGGDSEEAEEAEDIGEEGEEGVKGGGPVEDFLVASLHSKDEEIGLSEWGNVEDEEESLHSNDEEISLAEWGNVEDEEVSLAEWRNTEDEEYSLGEDVENFGDVVLHQENNLVIRGDYEQEEGDAIDGGEVGYEEEELKEEVHHEVVKDKSKQVGVFVVGPNSDPIETDAVELLNVKVLSDPITKNNRGFTFVNEAIFFMDTIPKNSEGFAYLQRASDDQAKAKIGVCMLSDPLVYGTPCGFAPSQNREPEEEITAQVKTVFVGDLPAAADENLIKKHVANFSDVDKTELARCQGTNNAELGRGTNKVHVRDRLSRPLERGRENHARGNFRTGLATHHMLANHAPTGFRGRGVPSSGHQTKRPPVGFVDRRPMIMSVSERARRFPPPQQFYVGSANGVGDWSCFRGLVNTFFSRGSNAGGSSYSSCHSGRGLSASRCSRPAASCY